ncbi:MAG TPA: hypothetical protein VN615_01275, partial [Gaiellales bacterium]|nr:hypothetical protein [Gaiellales bacterium]
MSVAPTTKRPSTATRLFQVGCLAYGLAVAYDSARKRRFDALEAAGRELPREAFEPLALPAAAPEPAVVAAPEVIARPEPEIAPAPEPEIVAAVAVEPEPVAWPQPRPRLALVAEPASEPEATVADEPEGTAPIVFEPIDESRAGLPDGLRDSLWARAAIRVLQAVCIAYGAALLYIVW